MSTRENIRLIARAPYCILDCLFMHLTSLVGTDHARIQKVLTEGSTFDNVSFLVVEGREDPNTTISGPSSVRQRNAIQMAFHWRADDGPTCRYVGLLRLPGRFASVIQHVDLCMKITSLFKADKHMYRQKDEMFIQKFHRNES